MSGNFPPIPQKRYFTIGEVGGLCDVKPHVLRYWEQEFPQLKPSKRRGNRRYYQSNDIVIVRKIRELLYNQGFTIHGARTQLSQPTSLVLQVKQAPKVESDFRQELANIRSELEQLLAAMV